MEAELTESQLLQMLHRFNLLYQVFQNEILLVVDEKTLGQKRDQTTGAP